MRIDLPVLSERMGANRFYQVQKIYELDGGFEQDDEFSNPFHVIRQIPYERLNEIEKDTAIVIPVKNERLRLLEGILSGIPHACLPIIVSNSQKGPIDRYRMEREMVDGFCRYAKKKYVIAHQRSPRTAEMFKAGGYADLLGDDGLLRNGKAEGMLAGIALAKILNKRYVGFIDADNYFPGSILEYIRIFSAGLSQRTSPYSMVRVQWHSKPKIVQKGLYFAKWGRVSRITNEYLNRLLGYYTGFETEALRTGNAGEHALTMDLALLLDYSSGFSVETHHFVSMLEKFGGIVPDSGMEWMKAGVDLFQIQSRNPHFHATEKGDEHIGEMIEGSLSVLFHSPVCPDILKKEILNELRKRRIVGKGQLPLRPRRYPALGNMDFDAAAKVYDWTRQCNFIPA